MALILDTSFLVALRNRRDKNHEKAKSLMRKALSGDLGTIWVSDYIFDEAVTLALTRSRRPEIAQDLGNYILGSRKIRLAFLSPQEFREAWKLFCQFLDRGFSFTDCTVLSQSQKLGIENIFSFDSHFDGLLTRYH